MQDRRIARLWEAEQRALGGLLHHGFGLLLGIIDGRRKNVLSLSWSAGRGEDLGSVPKSLFRCFYQYLEYCSALHPLFAAHGLPLNMIIQL